MYVLYSPESGGDVTLGASNENKNQSSETERLDDQFIGIIIGALGAVILLIGAIAVFIIVRRRRQKYSNGKQLKPTAATQHVTLNLEDLRALTNNGKVVSNGNLYNSIATSEFDSELQGEGEEHAKVKVIHNGDTYREPYDGIQARRLPELPTLGIPNTPDSASGQYTA